MDRGFRIDEVFAMAIQMEENGAEFYKKAAENADNKEAKELFEKLSRMEIEHKATFGNLREAVVVSQKPQASHGLSADADTYLKAIVDTKAFLQKPFSASSLEEVLREAIWSEKDTLVFYLGIRLGMADESVKEKLDTIIEEEMFHIRILSEKLKALKG